MSEENQRVSGDRKDSRIAAPAGPVAREKAAREKHRAKEERREAREEDLRRRRDEAYTAEVEKRGGLAALKPEPPPPPRGSFLNPPPEREHWPLPLVEQMDGPAHYRKPASPPGEIETELAAMIAECRHFMRGVAFESARMTPSVGDRLNFITHACRLAEASAKIGKSAAGLHGRESSVREVVQRIRVEDTRRGEGRGEGEGA